MTFRWCRCPRCGNAHFIKIRPDTRIINFPAYCKWCKTESVITIEPKSRSSYSRVD